MVELSNTVGGTVLSSYAVQDKMQQAELDPAMIVEEELFAAESWEPCLICGVADDAHGTMYCDGCDKTVHVFCAGYDDAPEVWYCEVCLVDFETDLGLPGMASAMRGRRRRRAQSARRRPRQRNEVVWARVWQEVSQRLDLDLDFPFDDDDEASNQHTEDQRRELARWQRRVEVANQQDANNRLREIANARIRQSDPSSPPHAESQEVLRAWNAFDKARASQEGPTGSQRRKRKSTASPAPSTQAEQTEQPPQKRPRLRPQGRPLDSHQRSAAITSSNLSPKSSANHPTFLSSLLREVESKPISASSPGASEHRTTQGLPHDNSSTAESSPSSGPGTPRALSVTPPPQRPSSPPLCSTIVPLSSPVAATFSPFSPAAVSRHRDRVNGLRRRGRRRSGSKGRSEEEPLDPRASSASPTRLSYSAKEEIQRMVKLSLRPRYHDNLISKDQYTTINRDVSRKLYDLVGDASALANQAERERFQETADNEVNKAVGALPTSETRND